VIAIAICRGRSGDSFAFGHAKEGITMFETLILLTATGILVVEFIEWRQKGEHSSEVAPYHIASDGLLRFGQETDRGHVMIWEGRR
jgi:hypothetical protein